MIGFNEINREREDLIDKLKKETKVLKAKADEYQLKFATLEINYKKMEE